MQLRTHRMEFWVFLWVLSVVLVGATEVALSTQP